MYQVINNYNLQKCQKDILPLIKKGQIFEDTTDITTYRGDIPLTCPHHTFDKFMNYLEVKTIEDNRIHAESVGITRTIIDFNKDKLEEMKKRLNYE